MIRIQIYNKARSVHREIMGERDGFMQKVVLLFLLLAYQMVKYRFQIISRPTPQPNLVLFPLQDARFAHISMSLIQIVFVLEFISHPLRDQGAVQRLLIILIGTAGVDVLFWLQSNNTRIAYDEQGLRVRNWLGKEKAIAWEEIREVRSSSLGLRQSRKYVLNTAKGTIRLNERSAGLERFRRILEEKL